MSLSITRTALKRVAVAASLMAVFSQGSFATKVVNDGYLSYSIATSGTLYLLAGVTVTKYGNTTQSSGLLGSTFDFPITGNPVGGANGLTSATFGGAGLTFTKGVNNDTYTNLSVDTTTNTIFGDRVGGSRIALFQGDGVSNVKNADSSFAYTMSGLSLTTAAAGLIGSKIGASSFLLNGINFGSLTVKAVPEPSTYALIGLGLVGASVVARRRRAT